MRYLTCALRFASAAAWRPTRAARGQGIVEFALILPIFLLLLFGIIEFALINASIGAFNFATQDAARYGAITGPTDPTSDSTMLTTIILPRINQIVAAQLVSVEIFKANEDGSCYGGTGAFPCATEDSYNAQSQQWSYGWPTSTRNDQLVVGDYLGVRITYTYTYVTAFFATISPVITLYAESVQRIEPQEYTWHGAPRRIAATTTIQARLADIAPALASRFQRALRNAIRNARAEAQTLGIRTWELIHLHAGSTHVETSSA